jgi:hypothetical protein
MQLPCSFHAAAMLAHRHAARALVVTATVRCVVVAAVAVVCPAACAEQRGLPHAPVRLHKGHKEVVGSRGGRAATHPNRQHRHQCIIRAVAPSSEHHHHTSGSMRAHTHTHAPSARSLRSTPSPPPARARPPPRTQPVEKVGGTQQAVGSEEARHAALCIGRATRVTKEVGGTQQAVGSEEARHAALCIGRTTRVTEITARRLFSQTRSDSLLS